ncbi:MAG: S53 family peptidase [Alphaproteobacteria bacterium]|nr:S53 family peptidase [Alphaproteobacteria bacterium]MBV9371505.1 S53 family peptidase [Alphaproteobacteria bacterium]MBV9902753.1 S53 family peptidase [Alphaproteobacteria bacterium]
MHLRKWGFAALALAYGVTVGTVASATKPVEKSGNVFHKAVCDKGPEDDAECLAHVVTDASGKEKPGKGADLSPNVVPSGYGPADLRSAYKITTDGTTTIAIVDAYGYPRAEQDLAVYRAQYGLPACTTANGCFKKVNQNGVQGSYPATNTGWSQESALDLDMASAMCPGCKLVLVEATTASYANLATAVRTAAAIAGVTVISNSYGGSETGTTTYEPSYNQPGKAVTVSTGDSGYGVGFPASSPHVIAVGGTHLVRASNARGWAETAWSSGGSGCSSVYAKPSFQTDALCTKRMEADVSAVGDPATGVAVYGPTSSTAQGWLVFGGTSVSAPIIGGIYGVTGHKPNGAATIYANASLLNDVTSGTNGSCGGTYFCTAGAGYDGPTGLGTPNGPGPF